MQLGTCERNALQTTVTLSSCYHQFLMESPTPSVSISTTFNDGKFDEVPCELLVPVNVNKTSHCGSTLPWSRIS
jgi:hypothetical protein